MAEDTYHITVKALIRNAEGKILLLKTRKEDLEKVGVANTYWDIPGGRVNRGEDATVALRREIKEETGITEIESLMPLSVSLTPVRIAEEGKEDVGLVASVFVCTMVGEQEVVLSHEHAEYAWFIPKEVSEIIADHYSDEVVQRIANLSFGMPARETSKRDGV